MQALPQLKKFLWIVIHEQYPATVWRGVAHGRAPRLDWPNVARVSRTATCTQ